MLDGPTGPDPGDHATFYMADIGQPHLPGRIGCQNGALAMRTIKDEPLARGKKREVPWALFGNAKLQGTTRTVHGPGDPAMFEQLETIAQIDKTDIRPAKQKQGIDRRNAGHPLRYESEPLLKICHRTYLSRA